MCKSFAKSGSSSLEMTDDWLTRVVFLLLSVIILPGNKNVNINLIFNEILVFF